MASDVAHERSGPAAGPKARAQPPAHPRQTGPDHLLYAQESAPPRGQRSARHARPRYPRRVSIRCQTPPRQARRRRAPGAPRRQHERSPGGRVALAGVVALGDAAPRTPPAARRRRCAPARRARSPRCWCWRRPAAGSRARRRRSPPRAPAANPVVPMQQRRAGRSGRRRGCAAVAAALLKSMATSAPASAAARSARYCSAPAGGAAAHAARCPWRRWPR